MAPRTQVGVRADQAQALAILGAVVAAEVHRRLPRVASRQLRWLLRLRRRRRRRRRRRAPRTRRPGRLPGLPALARLRGHVLRVARLLLCGSPVERGLAPAGERGRAGARAARVCRGAGRKKLARALPRQGQAQPPPAGWGVLSNAPRPPCAEIQRESAQRQAGRTAVRHTVRPVTADCAPAADQNPSLLRLGRFKLQRHVCMRWRVRPADQCPFVGTVILEKTARFCSQQRLWPRPVVEQKGWVECAQGFAATGTRRRPVLQVRAYHGSVLVRACLPGVSSRCSAAQVTRTLPASGLCRLAAHERDCASQPHSGVCKVPRLGQ